MPDLLLVNPSAKAETYGVLTELSAVEPPLWCALLAAYIRERGYSVAILDAEAEGLGAEETAKAIADHDPLLSAIIVLGINPSVSSTPKMTAVGRLLRALKGMAPHIRTVLAGLHPSALPQKTLEEEETDFVCQGEGFNTLLNLLYHLKSGAITPVPQGLWYRKGSTFVYGGNAQLLNPNELPMAAWDLLPMEKYRCHNWQALDDPDRRGPYALTYSSLGCCYSCEFCNIHALYGGKPLIRYRAPGEVAKEIDHLVKTYGIRKLKFFDEMLALNEKRVLELCKKIAALGHQLDAWCYGRVDTVDREMLKAMKEAGINWICYGIESLSELARLAVGKRYQQEKISEAVEMTRDAGLHIIGNFMFGFEEDNLETMEATLNMAMDFNFEWVNFYCLAPYPGSVLYHNALRDGVKMPTEWQDWSQFSPNFPAMSTKYLSGQEVVKFRDAAFRKYFSREEYLQMIKREFGEKAVSHIKKMLGTKLARA